jgi:arginyl-tRNA synthetase
VAEHAYRVAQSFSKFYAACPVLQAPDEATRASRLALAGDGAAQLRACWTCSGIGVPERM